jgi:C1A family cysteine protease
LSYLVVYRAFASQIGGLEDLVEIAARQAAALGMESALPSKYEIPHPLLPVVRDQGQRGTCAYFATVGLLETYSMADSAANAGITLSEECLVDVRDWMADQGSKYTGDDQPGVRPDPNGDYPTSIVKTVVRNGVPKAVKYSAAVDCTYNGDNSNGTDLPLENYLSAFSDSSQPSQAYGKGLKFDENTQPTIEQVKALIARNIPVEVGVVVYEEFMNGSDWRYDPKHDNSSSIVGGHAIQLTGYKTQGKKTIFTFKNSWKDSWGNRGFGTLDDGLLLNSWGYDPSYDFTVSLHK